MSYSYATLYSLDCWTATLKHPKRIHPAVRRSLRQTLQGLRRQETGGCLFGGLLNTDAWRRNGAVNSKDPQLSLKELASLAPPRAHHQIVRCGAGLEKRPCRKQGHDAGPLGVASGCCVPAVGLCLKACHCALCTLSKLKSSALHVLWKSGARHLPIHPLSLILPKCPEPPHQGFPGFQGFLGLGPTGPLADCCGQAEGHCHLIEARLSRSCWEGARGHSQAATLS